MLTWIIFVMASFSLREPLTLTQTPYFVTEVSERTQRRREEQSYFSQFLESWNRCRYEVFHSSSSKMFQSEALISTLAEPNQFPSTRTPPTHTASRSLGSPVGNLFPLPCQFLCQMNIQGRCINSDGTGRRSRKRSITSPPGSAEFSNLHLWMEQREKGKYILKKQTHFEKLFFWASGPVRCVSYM